MLIMQQLCYVNCPLEILRTPSLHGHRRQQKMMLTWFPNLKIHLVLNLVFSNQVQLKYDLHYSFLMYHYEYLQHMSVQCLKLWKIFYFVILLELSDPLALYHFMLKLELRCQNYLSHQMSEYFVGSYRL